MNELRPFVEAQFMELTLDEVLDRLHVVIRGLLDFLHLHRLLRSEIQVDVTHCLIFRLVDVC